MLTTAGDCTGIKNSRIALFDKVYPLKGRKILELSCYHGQDTAAMVERGAEVTVLEARKENIDACSSIRAKFIQGDVRHLSQYGLGHFDCILASGILYHVDDPLKLIQDLALLSDRVFVWTHVATRRYPRKRRYPLGLLFQHLDHYAGKWYSEGTTSSPTDGIQPFSFWLRKDALCRAMQVSGFKVRELQSGTNEHHQSWTTLWGEKRAS